MVELIGTVSAHSPNLIESPSPLPGAALRQYAELSRIRVRHWRAVFQDLPHEIDAIPAELQPLLRDRAESLFVDLLAGGLVARVWGAVLTACDRSRRTVAAERVARGVLAGQWQVQEAAARLLAESRHVTNERAGRLDRLRRTMERWTDLLLGHLVRRYAVVDFAYDLSRALDFGHEQVRDGWETRQDLIWDLHLLCLRTGFPQFQLPGGIQAIWRKKLMSSILSCLPPDLFQGDGPLLSVRMKRLLNSGVRREGPAGPARLTGPKFAGCNENRGRRRIDGTPGRGGEAAG
jgi:hypothetical protein